MIERAKGNETPISPKTDSHDPEIFSSKRIFFFNSYSGNHRSEIPNIESDYCPRDEVSRRLFHHGDESCDCDCTSDEYIGCFRRNKQCFFKFFVLALSIALILLLFGSLSYNLTRNKDLNKSLEFEGTEWEPHYHEYPVPKKKESLRSSFTNRDETKFALELPVPVYEHINDYDSNEDLIRFPHKFDGSFSRQHHQIEAISFPLLNDQNENSLDKILIYDGREPPKIKRSVPSRSERKERDLLKEEYEALEKLNDLEKRMEKFWENYFKKKKTIFKPFSLTTPFYYDSMGNDEYSLEEEIKDKLKNRFLSSAAPGNFHSVITPKEKTWKSSLNINLAGADETKITVSYESSLNDQTRRTETVNFNEYERTTSTASSYSPTEIKMTADKSSEAEGTFFSTANFKNSNFLIGKKVDHIYANNFEREYFGTLENSLSTGNEAFDKAAATETALVENTSPTEMIFFNQKSKMFSADERKFQTLWPLNYFSAPFTGLFDSSQKDRVSVESAPLDTVRGISLADAKKIKKERRKHLLLNSRVVGGSSDVRLPTGPDVLKPFVNVNAFETLKTDQQLSFTPSAASQFIFPYQMCLFAGSFPGPRSPAQVSQPRTFSFGSPHLIPSIFDKNSFTNSPSQVPAQQNFFSFSINNYPNAPPPRPPTQYSAFNFPTQKQFTQFQGSSKQPIFCTYLQPPLFQFPTVPGTADFSHAKCVDCPGDLLKDESLTKEFIFPSDRETFCSNDQVSCRDGSSCIPLKNWCDNQIQCKDASDETFCSCRERLAKDRLCDGYIDCPHGEDETACYDCPKSAFSCDSVIKPESCIPLSKRCDGVKDCSTGADEIDCSALFFNVQQDNSYQVPQINGYLHRNLKGNWFPVCVEINGSVWAEEACLGELGVWPSNMNVRFAPVSVHYKGPFIVRKEDGMATLQDHCKGHVSTFVKCPAMSCGTRVELYNLQKLGNHYFQKELDKSLLSSFSHIMTDSETKDSAIKIFKRNKDPRLKREETGRVVGGRESEPRAWPWAIAVYKNGAFHCGGVILDESWVLTAAHCMEQYWKHYYEVRGGMLRRFSFSAMEQARTVSHVIIHENYDLTIMSSDLALLRLQKPFDFNRWIRPACLPVLKDGISKFTSGPAPGAQCTAIGWGALKERGMDPDQLREVEIPIMTRCKHKEDLVGEEICAGKAEGGKDTCQGDSGGPLLCRDSNSPNSWYVAGIVSHGEGCARPGEPGAYTRISLFIDWIAANTNDFKLPSVKPLQNCPGFRCNSASKLCIPRKWMCNGFTDCLEAEDEKNCAFDSTTLYTFSRQYSSEHLESDFKGLNLGKDISASPNFGSATVTLTEIKNEKEETIKINNAEEKYLANEKSSDGEFREFIDSEKIKKITKSLESLFDCKNHVKLTELPLLPSLLTVSIGKSSTTATNSFIMKATEKPLINVGNLKMGTLLNKGSSVPKTGIKKSIHVLVNKESNNCKTVSTQKLENVYYKEVKDVEIKIKEKENTRETEGNKLWENKQGNENKINSANYKKEKKNGKKSTDKEIILVEQKEKKSENERNEMIFKHKEVKNMGAFEEENKLEIDKDYKKMKADYQKHELKEGNKEETSENGEEKSGKTEKNIKKTFKDSLSVKISKKKKGNVEKGEEKNSNEYDTMTEKMGSEKKGKKESSEKGEKDSISSEDWKTEDHSLQEDSSSTESFKIDSFQGITKEALINSNNIKEDEFFTNITDREETERLEENSAEGETLFTEAIFSGNNETTEKNILVSALEQVFERAEYIESDYSNIRSSQHLIFTPETISEYLNSEEYPVTTHYSVDSVTELSRRNSNVNFIFTSEYFQCRLIVQSILASYRCDGLEDCEDGTDEENCTCEQTLLRSNPKLICDGRIDCPDLSDEKNCSECLENEFLCEISNECIPKLGKCDGKTDCRFGEDETKCLALTKNSAGRLQPDGEPVLETEGFLIVNRNGVWKAKCQEETFTFGAADAIAVCSALGTIGYERFENRSLISENCTGFFVSCSKSLISSADRYRNRNGTYIWPWNAFVYSDGQFVCSAVLLQIRWLLTTSHCLKNVSLKKNYLIATLGSNNLPEKLKEAGTVTIRIDGAHVIPESNAALLHLSTEINQTKFVRPLGVPYTFTSDPKKDLCLAIRDQSIFLRISEDCPETFRCYKRVGSVPSNCRSEPWAGVVVCQSSFGWYPASVFLEKSGHCGFEDAKFSNLQDFQESLYYALDKKVEIYPEPICTGFRCSNGLCIPENKKCNGVPDCSSEEDENFVFCKAKNYIKDCKITELKCRNGRCIPKVFFGNGMNDCGDESDEPWNATCVEYLKLTAPRRICDGRRNCYDKTDENYNLCSCEKGKFQCKLSGYCVPKDFVCDGEKDCPEGEDEEQCMGRQIRKNSSKSHLEVMQKSYGIWHTMCPDRMTKERSDALCRDLGFKEASSIYGRNQSVIAPKLDAFSWVKLNRKTSIALRGDKPFVKLVSMKKICDVVKCA